MAVTDQPMTRFHLIQRNSEQRRQRLAKHSLRLSESFPVYRLCNIKKKKRKLHGFMIFTCTSQQLYIFGPLYSYLETVQVNKSTNLPSSDILNPFHNTLYKIDS